MDGQNSNAQCRYESAEEYIAAVREEVVTESGIPTDGYHMGKLMYHVLKKYPHATNQIDGISGIREKNKSVLKRTVQLATSLSGFGLEVGDVVALMGPHHLDLCLPVFASQLIGAAIMPWPEASTTVELRHYLQLSGAKIVFCQHEHTMKLTPLQKEFEFEIVTFDVGPQHLTLEQFIEIHSTEKTTSNFRVPEFNPYDTTAWLLSTSGSTGRPKVVVITQANVAHQLPTMWKDEIQGSVPPATRLILVVSPMQWVTTMAMYTNGLMFVSPRVQTSKPITPDLLIEIIKNHRPSFVVVSPTLSKVLLERRDECDLSCFSSWSIAGCHMPKEILSEARKMFTKGLSHAIGMTELAGLMLYPNHIVENVSLGKAIPVLQYKLVDEKGKEVDVDEVGELWVKGPAVCKGYLKDPDATREAFTADGWLRTGDLMRRDRDGFYYYHERIKLMLKCMDCSAADVLDMNYSIAPAEIESVIRQLDGIDDVVVTSVDSPSGGDLPVAAVVRSPGRRVTAQLIKQHVEDTLSERKQLRGGVVFLDKFPTMPSMKINRRQIKMIVAAAERE